MKYNSSVILVVVIGSSHRRRAKPPLGTVLIINLLRKGLTPRACMGDGGSDGVVNCEQSLVFLCKVTARETEVRE